MENNTKRVIKRGSNLARLFIIFISVFLKENDITHYRKTQIPNPK